MDMDDGEVRYKGSIDMGSTASLDADTISTLSGFTLATMDRYFGALMSVVYGGVVPRQAVQNVEQGVPNQSANTVSMEQ
jgi:hypothetical protein